MQHSNCSTCISSFNPHTNQKRDRLVDCHFLGKVTTYREIEEPAQCHTTDEGQSLDSNPGIHSKVHALVHDTAVSYGAL